MKPKGDTAFLGHPAGLGWLSGAEFWERFSYYGMQALLVLYATNYLLLPGHVEKVWGFVPFSHALEAVYGALTPGAMASIIFGWYAGLVYVTPLAGGLIADRLIGRTAAVTIGALLMALGHFLMAFEASFLLALLCLLLGVGCFKGNIAAQVGDLYGEGDHRRADGFQIYYIGIQLAGIVTPLVCGTLGETYGWHWGFGAAGVGMLLGLATYLVGRPTLPREKKRGGEVVRPPMTTRDRQAVILLCLLVPVITLTLLGNQQMFNTYLVWGQKNLETMFFGWRMPITWLLSVDGIASAILMTGTVLFWRWYGRHWPEPDELGKMTVGTAIATGGPLLLAAASMAVARSGQPASLWWAIGFHIVNDTGISSILPVVLALYSRAAPKGLEGMMIAVSYLAFFASNMAVGWLGSLYGTMTPTLFWLLHAGLVFGAGLVLFLVRRFAGKVLAPPYAAPRAP
jgi:POT family proton-dependent oligopeptide transporter